MPVPTPRIVENVQALFQRGYQIIQTNRMNFSLVRLDEYNIDHTKEEPVVQLVKIVEFEMDNVNETQEAIYNRLLSEINYYIREFEVVIDLEDEEREGLHDNEFSDMSASVFVLYKDIDFPRLKDLRDFLK